MKDDLYHLKGLAMRRTALQIIGRCLAAVGLLAIVSWVWIAAGLPLWFDRLLVESEAPMQARAIVCITGGLGANSLPTPEGWERVYSAVQLVVDGYAPVLIVSGGGSRNVSEAEVYAEAAVWLGCPSKAIVLDPHPHGTAEHPASIQKLPGLELRVTSALDIVTSPLHSKRVAMCFRKAGFRNFRMVTSWVARRTDPKYVREQRASQIASFRSSGKSYGDVLNRTKWRTAYTFTALHEAAALAWYWWRGKV